MSLIDLELEESGSGYVEGVNWSLRLLQWER